MLSIIASSALIEFWTSCPEVELVDSIVKLTVLTSAEILSQNQDVNRQFAGDVQVYEYENYPKTMVII
ncbi:unnamed protein product [Paramecium pentaurelia]|uniref:Uncharacterized protein n=1 Tax=Paramecium pentaurelia TaxID=43138 RepID=A0A8S1VSL2_9CILI|nr:unnamed protein product [Paramecium pentaurelia]